MESNSVMSAILTVIHLKLYKAGQETFNYLRNAAKTTVDIKVQNVLSQWTSAFNGISVIGNCIVPLHWDVNSRFPWYDLLITLGSYCDCTLELPQLVSQRFQHHHATVNAGPTPIKASLRVITKGARRNNVHFISNTLGNRH